MKSYTDLKQSRKLAEILPIETADMVLLHEEPYETSDSKFDGLHQALCVPFSKYDKSWRQKYKNIHYFPCWSLASLLDVLNKTAYFMDEDASVDLSSYKTIEWDLGITNSDVELVTESNSVDACVEMIIKLKERNIL